MHKNQEIERLRAIAVMMVVITHFHPLQDVLPKMLKTPWTGVDLFFVISGFVVTLSLMRLLPDFKNLNFTERVSAARDALRTFYLRRVFRILPACFAWMFVYFFLACFFAGTASQGFFGTPQHLAREMIYFSSGFYNYLRYANDLNVYYLGPYWSLTVEEHFYLILPWIFVFFASRFSRGWAVFCGILIVAGILRPFIPTPSNFDPVAFNMFPSHRRFDTLFIGVLLALVTMPTGAPSVNGTKTVPLPRALLLSILPLFFVFMIWAAPGTLPYPFNVNMGFVVYALAGAGLVYLASLQQGFIFEFPGIKQLLEHMGSRSYAIYLAMSAMTNLHIVWMNKLLPLLPKWVATSVPGAIAQFAFLWVVLLIVAELSYRLVEVPMINYGKKVIQRGSKAQAAFVD